MLTKRLLSVARIQSKALHLSARRAAAPVAHHDDHHHDSHNPGPPVTYDYIPVPFQKYQTVYGELQSKFNMYLAITSALLVTSFTIAILDDVFILEAIRPPKSYRERNNH